MTELNKGRSLQNVTRDAMLQESKGQGQQVTNPTKTREMLSAVAINRKMEIRVLEDWDPKKDTSHMYLILDMATTSSNLTAPNIFQLITVRLDGSNYLNRVSQIIPVLRCHDLAGFLDGSEVCPAEFMITDNGNISNLDLVAEKGLDVLGCLNASLTEKILSFMNNLSNKDLDVSKGTDRRIDQSLSGRPPLQICTKPGHTALDCYHRMDYSYQGSRDLT
ncbi:hypothetical protein M569_00172 [Genlisea aurea]|uniref:Uncharacterized protein n=1 Tax=Genlisea aurea TaxID=192259 RepID=S8EEZ9_9LAMI|nr:hypothetical protein M569_00172 [Genlisea aurea]